MDRRCHVPNSARPVHVGSRRLAIIQLLVSYAIIRFSHIFEQHLSYFSPNIWHVQIVPTLSNGLTKPSAVDTLQVRGMDRQRFIRKLAEVSPAILEEIVLAIAAIIEFP